MCTYFNKYIIITNILDLNPTHFKNKIQASYQRYVMKLDDPLDKNHWVTMAVIIKRKDFPYYFPVYFQDFSRA